METKQLNQHAAGAVSMLLGLILVFGLIITMNHYMGKIERAPAQEVTEISMTREIKQEPKKEIKKDSKVAIQELIALGVTPIMLTGDNEKAAKYVADHVNIQHVFGNMLPENKAKKIKEFLQEYTFVAMVGDGINDAPALALSTVGIAMGAAGSDTAIETANVALMNDNLSKIPFLIRLGKKTLNRIRINTIAAVLVKFVFIVLAFLV